MYSKVMLETLLVLFIILWFLGYIQVPGLTIPNITLFELNGRVISLINLFIFLLIVAAIGVLPTPLRQIAFGVLILWLLATFNILAIPGLASILVIAMILGVLISIFQSRSYHHKYDIE